MGDNGRAILVIGGGMAGMTAAIEAAEAGCAVILVEKAPYLGGRVTRTNQYFRKLCPPACGLEIDFRRIKVNPRIKVLAPAEVEKLSGSPGDFEATVKILPRFITEACTLCGACAQACHAEIPDEFNYGLSRTKAAYLPHAMAFPACYVIQRSACPQGCKACVEPCAYGAVDLDQQSERRTYRVAAVVAATGWAPYDAARIENLGYGKYPNVLTNVVMERLAAPDGPTGGKILRPSDAKPPDSVVFVQCAASLKQAGYVRALYPGASITIFYIDIRTPGRLEDFYARIAADDKLELIKGKAAKVEEDSATGDLLVTAEDALQGKLITRRAGLLVLATGIVPQTQSLPPCLPLDEFGFLGAPPGRTGLYAAGCVRRLEEVSASVQDATGAALKALQCVVRSAHHE